MKTSIAHKLCSSLIALTLCCAFAPGAYALDGEDGAVADLVSEATTALSAEPENSERATEATSDTEGESPEHDGEAGETGSLGETDAESSETGDDASGTDRPNDSDEGAENVVPPIEAGTYLIQSFAGSRQVLDVAAGSLDDGANVQTYESNMSLAQRFSIAFDQNGFATITNVNSGKVLDVAGGEAVSGTNVQQYASNESDAQKWVLTENADGSFTVESKLAEGLVLDVAGGCASDGSNVQVYAANGTDAQRFALISDKVETVAPSDEVAAGTYVVCSMLGNALAMDVPGGSFDNGVQLQLWGASGTMNQMFLVTVEADGYASVQSVRSGKLLDVDSGNLALGTKVQQWERTDGVNQDWSLQARADGGYDLISRANGMALDVSGAQATNGAQLQTYLPNGTAAQGWTLEPVERVIAEGVYTFGSMLGNGLAVDVKDASSADGARLQIWAFNGTPAQKFKVSWTAYEIEDAETGEELGELTEETAEDTSAASKAEAIVLTPLTGAGHYVTGWDDGTVSLEKALAGELNRQRWIPAASEHGGITLQNVATGQVLDVAGAGTYDGCSIGTYAANGSKAQAFRATSVDPIGNGTFVVQSLVDGRALDVAGASRSNGANVQVWAQNGSGAQAWIVEGVGDGYYRLTNARSKKALDVVNGVGCDGANVQQWEVNGADAQRWRAVVNGDGSYTFVSACGGYALDVSGGGGWDGANVQLYTDNGTAAQKWRLVSTVYVPEDFTDLLGTFTTYSTNTWAGTYNMQRALSSFNGIVIEPGASLSFYSVTGPCGAAQGYMLAGVVGGLGYGGGICQASTTLYGAAIRSGFAILDRQNHSVPSTYVPIGLDAMVNWGTSDLVIRNDTGNPVKIVTHTYDNVLTCEMWGIQPEWYDYIEPISWYTSGSSANAQRTYYKNGQAVYTEMLPASYYY